MYTDKTPLTYVQESKLGALQIRWLSEVTVFDFQIYYYSERSKRVADALNCQPQNADSSSESRSDSDVAEAI